MSFRFETTLIQSRQESKNDAKFRIFDLCEN